MACPAKPPGSLPAGHCSPGVAYPAGDGLNTCTCGRSGLRSDARCTSLVCPRLPPSDETAASEGNCCPGLSYAEGCNTCNCAPSGLKNGSTCTEILCPPSALQPGRCIPLVAYPAGDGLNTCTCSGSGLMNESSCTNLTCPAALPAVLPAQSPGLAASAPSRGVRPSRPRTGPWRGVPSLRGFLSQTSEASSPSEASCCPGLLFTAEDGCNTCSCPTDGSKTAAGCTKMACPAKPPGSLPAGHCSPGVAYPAGDGLNTCTCGRSGLRSDARCTSLVCPRLPPSDETAASEGNCCPGLSYAEGCNTCNCAPSGLKNGSTCTEILCPPSALQPGRCIPLVAYPAGDGLNTCTCRRSGLINESSCTNLPCPAALPAVQPAQNVIPASATEDRCCPGLLYGRACNTCTCAPSGLKNESSCTDMACSRAELPLGRCSPRVAYPAGDGLNTCTCSWSGLMSESNCTNLTCPVVPAPQSSVPLGTGQCCPGLLYSQGCNTCACAPSGLKNQSNCSEIECPRSDLPSGRCAPRVSYPAGDDLNTCTCPWSGLVSESECTSLSCPSAPPTPVPAPVASTSVPPAAEDEVCCPGLLFPAEDGCNTCSCPRNGSKLGASCSRIACPPTPTLLPTGRCFPWTAFPKRDGVNTCSCPASGLRSAASCTSFACPR